MSAIAATTPRYTIIEEHQRIRRGSFVIWFRAELFDADGALITITRRVETRSLAQADGERALAILATPLELRPLPECPRCRYPIHDYGCGCNRPAVTS